MKTSQTLTLIFYIRPGTLKGEGVKRNPKIEGKFSPGVGLHLHPLNRVDHKDESIKKMCVLC